MTRLKTERSEIQIPVGARDFSLLKIVQTGSGAHPTSSAGTGDFLFSGGRAVGA